MVCHGASGVGGNLSAEYQGFSAANNPEREYGYRNGQLLISANSGTLGNLAQGQPASRWRIGYGRAASRAVDSNASGNWGNGSVTHTQVQTKP